MGGRDVAVAMLSAATLLLGGAYTVAYEVVTRTQFEVSPTTVLMQTGYENSLSGTLDVAPSQSRLTVITHALPAAGTGFEYRWRVERDHAAALELAAGPQDLVGRVSLDFDFAGDLSDAGTVRLMVGPPGGPYVELASAALELGHFSTGRMFTKIEGVGGTESFARFWSPGGERLNVLAEFGDAPRLDGFEYRFWLREDAISNLNDVPDVSGRLQKDERFILYESTIEAPPRRDIDTWRGDHHEVPINSRAIDDLVTTGDRYTLLGTFTGRVGSGPPPRIDTSLVRADDMIATYRFLTIDLPGADPLRPAGFVVMTDDYWI